MVICVVEAMLVHNEIWAEDYGIVFDVSVKNQAFVEYSQVLFRVIPLPDYTAPRYGEFAVTSLLREIIGSPFRPVRVAPRWLTSPVVTLAATMYESREFTPMPILADALEEAGCDNPDVLTHCRGPGPHVRGCWVVDLILGKS